MRDKSSFRIIWSKGSREMSEAIGAEVQHICRQAAEPVRAGESIKHQLRRAWENLGRPAFWRLRSGWYGEGGAWSAAAVADFQCRYLALTERQVRLAAQRQAIENAKRGVSAPSEQDLAREEFGALLSRIAAVETALRLRPADENGAPRDEVGGLARGADRALDRGGRREAGLSRTRQLEEQYRADAMSDAEEKQLYAEYVEARRVAAETDDPADLRYAAKAYARFMRIGLTDPERRAVELENEVARLAAENRALRECGPDYEPPKE